jgi:radical SAM protein with 4Fe4S-binding SPASM domain
MSTKLVDRDFQITLKKYFGSKIANHLGKKCPQCGKERFLSGIDYYLGKKQRCVSCYLTGIVIKPMINLFFKKLSFKQETIGQILNDDLLRKTMLNLIKGFAYFGIKIPQPTRVPVVIVWNVTNKCNLHCLHCHQASSSSLQQKELTTNEAFKIIDNLSNAGLSILTFSGGEPLIRKDIYDLIQRATKNGIYCTIASNGILMKPETVKKLYNAGIKRVEIGLDGAQPKTHDFLRNKKGSFKATIKGIQNCVKNNYFEEVAITTTLYKSNAVEISQIVNLAESLGATRFYLNRLIPAGRGVNITNLDVSNKEKRRILDYLYNRFHKSVINGNGIQCYTRGMTYLSRVGYQQSHGQIFHVSEAFSGYDIMFKQKFDGELSRFVRKFAKGFSGCSAGLTYCGLSAQGDILPCVPAHINLGNLLEKNLEDIWANDETLKHMRDRKNLKGSCGQCNYNGLCGGCRYTAYFMTNDWLGPDLSCPYGDMS